jgi:hypothetical protein
MNGFISIMQDVAKLVTGGSDLARAEARHIDDERAHTAAERIRGSALHSPAIIVFASTEPPVDRLMRLRLTTARVVRLGALVRNSSIRCIRAVR